MIILEILLEILCFAMKLIWLAIRIVWFAIVTVWLIIKAIWLMTRTIWSGDKSGAVFKGIAVDFFKGIGRDLLVVGKTILFLAIPAEETFDIISDEIGRFWSSMEWNLMSIVWGIIEGIGKGIGKFFEFIHDKITGLFEVPIEIKTYIDIHYIQPTIGAWTKRQGIINDNISKITRAGKIYYINIYACLTKDASEFTRFTLEFSYDTKKLSQESAELKFSQVPILVQDYLRKNSSGVNDENTKICRIIRPHHKPMYEVNSFIDKNIDGIKIEIFKNEIVLK